MGRKIVKRFQDDRKCKADVQLENYLNENKNQKMVSMSVGAIDVNLSTDITIIAVFEEE